MLSRVKRAYTHAALALLSRLSRPSVAKTSASGCQTRTSHSPESAPWQARNGTPGSTLDALLPPQQHWATALCHAAKRSAISAHGGETSSVE